MSEKRYTTPSCEPLLLDLAGCLEPYRPGALYDSIGLSERLESLALPDEFRRFVHERVLAFAKGEGEAEIVIRLHPQNPRAEQERVKQFGGMEVCVVRDDDEGFVCDAWGVRDPEQVGKPPADYSWPQYRRANGVPEPCERRI